MVDKVVNYNVNVYDESHSFYKSGELTGVMEQRSTVLELTSKVKEPIKNLDVYCFG